MKKLVFFIALAAFGQQTGYKYNPFTQNLDLAGNGFTAPSGYSTALSGALTSTITAATHGQGTMPDVMCWQSSNGEKVSPQVLNPSFLGDITLNFSPAFTGTCKIVGPGVNTGAAGDVVGPSSSTSGCVAYFSGTSGKIITCSPTGLFYDSANVRLGVGTASPVATIEATSSGATTSKLSNSATGGISLDVRNSGISGIGVYSIVSGGGGGVNAAGYFQATGGATNWAIQVPASGGNIVFGGSSNGNYKLDVQASGSTGTLRAFNQAVGGSTLVVVQAGDTQSGNLLSVLNNAGSTIASISNLGTINSTVRVSTSGDFLLNTSGVVQFTNPGDGILTLKDNSGSTFNRINLGGNTSSYVALKRNGTSLETRLADDSAYAPITTGIHKFAGTNSTGAGSALLGANSPASTLTAPYTWITVVTADGSTAYIPAWK